MAACSWCALPVTLGALLQAKLTFYTAAGVLISSTVGLQQVGGPGNDWIERMQSQVVAPATASYARISIEYVGTSSDSAQPQVGDEMWLVGALLQLVPQDGDVVLTKRGEFGRAEPIWQLDFENPDPNFEYINAEIIPAGPLGTGTVGHIDFTPAPGSSGWMSIYIDGLFKAGKSYAVVLDSVNPENGAATEIRISGTTHKGPFTASHGDLVGGTRQENNGEGAFECDVISTVAQTVTIYGIAVYEVEWSTDYFDGSSPNSGGQYFRWLGTENQSASAAEGGLAVDPCSWCSEFILSYLPPNTDLSVDAIRERAYATVAGGPEQPADTLLYGSDGGPMSWSSLSCNIPYLFAIDVPEPLLDDVRISLELAQRE